MTPTDTPQPPALARASLDRCAAERDEPDLLHRLRRSAGTRVVPVHGDLAPTHGDRLITVAPDQVDPAARWAFLGRDAAGTALLVAATSAAEPAPVDAVPETATWSALRAAGGELIADDAGVFVEAVALARWLVGAPFCPACGVRADERKAGWSRVCPACGAEHFPRADPAVIVAVVSADGERMLLGRNALWATQRMFSTFAGFVEAGESAESAIVREVAEEAGVSVTDLEYRGSQAWPYPHSLMLGFRARAERDTDARADGEEIVEVRWFTRTELVRGLAGTADFTLPGTASIAHRLIADWVGA